MEVTLALSLPRDARHVGVMRRVVECVLADLQVPEHAVDDVRLAVGEACANAVRHAAGSPGYSVHVTIDAGGCCVEVSDHGPGFEPDDEPALPDPTTEYGRGIALMRELSDEVEFLPSDGGTLVRMEKHWPPVAAAC